MLYIIMCGGNYKDKFEKPKQLLEINGEVLVERTIRLLKDNGVKDIAISTNNPAFDYLGIKILNHKNEFEHNGKDNNRMSNKSWLNAYYPTEEECCYLHGDVYYSEQAIQTIVDTEVKDTMFFCIRDISDGRPAGINTKGREPLAYKVQNQKVFRKAINELLQMIDDGMFGSDPISWNLYRQINGIQLDYNGYGNNIFDTKGNYIAIDDYTTDIDAEADIPKLEKLLKKLKGEIKMIKVEALEDFYLGKYNELQNIVRNDKDEWGRLFKGDTFECDEEMANYLTVTNAKGRSFVRIIEIIPEKVTEEIKEEEPVVEIKKTEKPKRKRKTIAEKD